MGHSDKEHKELLGRVVQVASQRLGWWSLEMELDESYRFAGGFPSGNTVDVHGDTLRECLERAEGALRTGTR